MSLDIEAKDRKLDEARKNEEKLKKLQQKHLKFH